MKFSIRTHAEYAFEVDWRTPIITVDTNPVTLMQILYALIRAINDEDLGLFEVDLEDYHEAHTDDLINAFMIKALFTKDAADIDYVHDILGLGSSPLGFDFRNEDYESALEVADALFPDLLPGTALKGKVFKAKGPIYSNEPRKRLDYFVEVENDNA